MSTKTQWKPSDISNPIHMRSNDLEFQAMNGEWINFTVIATPERIVFGGVTNTGFLESGYMERDGESLDESLSELLAELETFYNDGRQYVTRIVTNERM